MPTTKDINGMTVRVGDTVRVLGFQEGLFTTMPEDEVPLVKSMLNEVLAVEEIDAQGVAWVYKSWSLGEGVCNSQGLGLEPMEMELVDQ